MLRLSVCFLRVDSLIVTRILRWPVMACVAGGSAGGEAGWVSRQLGCTLKMPLTVLSSLLAGGRFSLLRWNCGAVDKLCFAAFLWFLPSDRQECGKTGNSSAPKMHRRGEKSRLLQNLRNIIQESKGML